MKKIIVVMISLFTFAMYVQAVCPYIKENAEKCGGFTFPVGIICIVVRCKIGRAKKYFSISGKSKYHV